VTIDPLGVQGLSEEWHGAAFRVRWAGLDTILLSAVERNGQVQDDDASPGLMWGCTEARTDARCAIVALSGNAPTVLVNGSMVEAPGQSVRLEGPALAYVSMASTVHEM
jgi:hypothetical protein